MPIPATPHETRGGYATVVRVAVSASAEEYQGSDGMPAHANFSHVALDHGAAYCSHRACVAVEGTSGATRAVAHQLTAVHDECGLRPVVDSASILRNKRGGLLSDGVDPRARM